MPVVNLADYRAPRINGPFTITFIGFSFGTPEGRQDQLTLSINVKDGGDPAVIIDAIKAQGWVYLPSRDGEKPFWFLPWPCAAVRISPVKA